jgi:hypothetical protein
VNRRVLRGFLTRLDEIDGYRKSLIASAKLAGMSAPESRPEVRGLVEELGHDVSRGTRKRLDYSSLVVALYGTLEDYVERIAEQCAEVLNGSVSRYLDLPESMRKFHEKGSLTLVEQVLRSAYTGPLTQRDLIANVHGCLEGRSPYRLNFEAFSIHTANVRNGIVRELLSRVGVEGVDEAVGSDIRTTELLNRYGRSDGEPHFYVNDLADRRNMVAHGEAPPDVLSLDVLHEYSEALRVFGELLFEKALCGVLNIAMPRTAVLIGNPTASYKSGKILCYSPSHAFSLRLGDSLAWETGAGWRVSVIESLEVDHKARNSLIGNPKDKFGVGISVNGNSKAEYWVIPA